MVRASLEVYLAGMRRTHPPTARLRVVGGALTDASLADFGELSRGEPRYTADQAQLPHQAGQVRGSLLRARLQRPIA